MIPTSPTLSERLMLRLDLVMHQDLKQAAGDRGMSVNELIRIACRRELGRPPVLTATTKKNIPELWRPVILEAQKSIIRVQEMELEMARMLAEHQERQELLLEAIQELSTPVAAKERVETAEAEMRKWQEVPKPAPHLTAAELNTMVSDPAVRAALR